MISLISKTNNQFTLSLKFAHSTFENQRSSRFYLFFLRDFSWKKKKEETNWPILKWQTINSFPHSFNFNLISYFSELLNFQTTFSKRFLDQTGKSFQKKKKKTPSTVIWLSLMLFLKYAILLGFHTTKSFYYSHYFFSKLLCQRKKELMTNFFFLFSGNLDILCWFFLIFIILWRIFILDYCSWLVNFKIIK